MSRMLYLFLCFLRLIFALSERVTVNHWCQSSCGNITIPYPFGIGTGCFMDSWTEMECDYTHKLFLKKFKDYEVVKVSHTEVSVTINIYTTNQRKSFFRTYPGLHSSPFTFTSNNKFITVGCGIQGIIDADLGLASNFSSGCVNFCKRYDLGECQGFGCCEISIPGNMKQYRIAAFRLSALTTNITSSPIGYAFLADESYKFKVSDLDPSTKTTVGLNFVVGNQTCEYAAQDPSSFVSVRFASMGVANDGDGEEEEEEPVFLGTWTDSGRV